MIRVGHGFDLHRVAAGRALVLGGVTIPWRAGLLGHSDADVLIHAIIDAMLGALALGDIGGWFPDSDPRFRDIASTRLLATVMADARLGAWRIGNVDSTILAEQPRLAPHIPAIRQSLATALHTDVDRVSVKAKTMEGLGWIGTGEAIAAHAVVILES